MMPGMDGFEVCRRIKNNPKTAHIPVVMVTALDQPSDRVAGLDAGADDFLTKPVDDAALFARVRSLVRLKMMTDELRMRETTGQSMGLIDPATTLMDANPTGRILIIEDRPESVAWFSTALAAATSGLVGRHVRRSAGARARRRLRSHRRQPRHARLRRPASVLAAALLARRPQRSDPGRGQRRRSPQADPGARDGRQRLSDPPGRQERARGARAHADCARSAMPTACATTCSSASRWRSPTSSPACTIAATCRAISTICCRVGRPHGQAARLPHSRHRLLQGGQ